jgi:hypothetical protein
VSDNPADQQLERCAQLVHATPRRRRYRLNSSTPLDWIKLQRHLGQHLAKPGLLCRVNPKARSVVISSRTDNTSVLEDSVPILMAALAEAGASPPSTVLVPMAPVRTTVRVEALRPWRWLLVPVNLASMAISLSLLSLAAIIALVGLLGLVLPLAPGASLLVLAGLAVELALWLRLPFLDQTTA